MAGWRNHFSSASANSVGRCDRHENVDSGISRPGLGALLRGFTETPHIWARSRVRWEPTGAGTGQEQAVGVGRRRWGWGDGGGSGETAVGVRRPWNKAGRRGDGRPETTLASGRKAEGSPLSPKAPSLLPELNGFTEHRNQEEQFLSALINNPEHLPHTRCCLRGRGGGGDGGNVKINKSESSS